MKNLRDPYDEGSSTPIDAYGMDPMEIMIAHECMDEADYDPPVPVEEEITLSDGYQVKTDEVQLVGHSSLYLSIEGSYWTISGHGEVRTSRGTVSIPDKARGGMLRNYVRMVDGKQQWQWVAEMVLTAHARPRPSERHRPLFRDGNFNNCHIDNLNWVAFKKKEKDTRTRADKALDRELERFLEPKGIYEYF